MLYDLDIFDVDIESLCINYMTRRKIGGFYILVYEGK